MSDKEINIFYLHTLTELLENLNNWQKKIDELPEYIERCHDNILKYKETLIKLFGESKSEIILTIIRNNRFKSNKAKIEKILKEVDCYEKYKFLQRNRNFDLGNVNCKDCWDRHYICEECLKKAKESGWKKREVWDFKDRSHWE